MCSFHVLILRFPWALLAFTRFGIQNLWKYFKYSTYRMLNRRDQKGRFRYEKYLRVWNYYVAEPHLLTPPNGTSHSNKKLIQSADEFIVNIELLNKLSVHIFRLMNLDPVNQGVQQSLRQLVDIGVLFY